MLCLLLLLLLWRLHDSEGNLTCTTFCWIAHGQPKDYNIPPPPLWREEHEYHTTTVEEQMPDTNLVREKLEDTPANINVVLSSQCSSHNTTNRSRASALGTLLQTTITTSGRRALVSGPSSRAHIISICKQCHLNHVLYLQIGFNIIIPMFSCLYL